MYRLGIISLINARRSMIWTGNVAGMRKKRNAFRDLVERRIILKWSL
jgi:hypothetical protein